MGLHAFSGASRGTAVTKSDATVLPVTSALYVGTAGTLVVTMAGAEVTIPNAPVGYHPLHVTQVKAATAAADIVALYGGQ